MGLEYSIQRFSKGALNISCISWLRRQSTGAIIIQCYFETIKTTLVWCMVSKTDMIDHITVLTLDPFLQSGLGVE